MVGERGWARGLERGRQEQCAFFSCVHRRQKKKVNESVGLVTEPSGLGGGWFICMVVACGIYRLLFDRSRGCV